MTQIQDIDQQIKQKLQEVNLAVENQKKFLGEEIIPGKEIKPKDFFKMAEAFDTRDLRILELDTLFAKKYRFKNWENEVSLFEKKAEELREKIEHWKKREFPSKVSNT